MRDLESAQPAQGPLTGHGSWVHAVAIDVRQGPSVIVSGGSDGTVHLHIPSELHKHRSMMFVPATLSAICT
jgi:hypothetical protein